MTELDWQEYVARSRGRWKNQISLFQQQQTIMWLKPHQEITLEFLFSGVI